MAPVRVLPAPDSAIYGAPVNNAPPSEYLADATRLLSDTAATIIDYTQGGIYHDGAYQDEVGRCVRQAGSYWIADEVVTGAGRQATGSRSRERRVAPYLTLGKSLGGGGRQSLRSWCRRTSSSGSRHGGRTTARCAVIQSACPPSAPTSRSSAKRKSGSSDRQGKLFTRRLLAIAQKLRACSAWRGRGCTDGGTARPGLAQLGCRDDRGADRLAVAERALEAGAVIGTSGEQASLSWHRRS